VDFVLAGPLTALNFPMMNRLLAVVLVVASGSFTWAAEQPEFTTNTLAVSELAVLRIQSPKDWSFETKGAGNPTGPRTAALRSEDGGVSVQITMFRNGFSPNQFKPTDDKMAQMVKSAAESQFLASSMEKKVEVEKLKGAQVSGSFARFTDAKWAEKKLPPGEFSNVAIGVLRCGDLWGNFTLLSSDKDGPHFKQGLAVLEAMRQEKP